MTKKENKNKSNSSLEYLKERVPITLRRPESEKKDFRTVTVNGINYQIAYGHQVMVPRFVAKVIEESEKNAELAKIHADEKAEEFARGQSNLNG